MQCRQVQQLRNDASVFFIASKFFQLEESPAGQVCNRNPEQCPNEVDTSIRLFATCQDDGRKAKDGQDGLNDFLKGLHGTKDLCGTGNGASVLGTVVIDRESATVFRTQTGCIVPDQGRFAVIAADYQGTANFQKKESATKGWFHKIGFYLVSMNRSPTLTCSWPIRSAFSCA